MSTQSQVFSIVGEEVVRVTIRVVILETDSLTVDLLETPHLAQRITNICL
jgi:hypothetical protein